MRLMATAVSVKITSLIVAVDEAAQLDASDRMRHVHLSQRAGTPPPALSTELRWYVGISSIYAKNNSRRLECLI